MAKQGRSRITGRIANLPTPHLQASQPKLGVAGFLGKLAKPFRRKTKLPPVKPRKTPKLRTLYPGHFGIHVTSRRMREQRVTEGLPQFTKKERKLWKEMGPETLQTFVYDGLPVRVHSSNVDSASYDIDEGILRIVYKNGSEYRYSDISEDEAIQFATYASKGSFVWDHLRVRGTRDGARKPYVKMS